MSGQDESVGEREARAARNEAVFRTVNAEMENLNESFGMVPDAQFSVVCECSRMACAEQIQLTSTTYARIRTEPRLFIVLPGHEDPKAEAVVESEPGYVVVKKPSGRATEIAADTAPE